MIRFSVMWDDEPDQHGQKIKEVSQNDEKIFS